MRRRRLALSGVLLVGVECHGVAVFGPEFIACKHLGRGKQLVRWGRRRHRQHDVVHQFDGAARLAGVPGLAVLPGRELEVPAPHQFLLVRLGYSLSVIRLDVDLSSLADVSEVSSDRTEGPGPAGHFNQDFRRSTHCAPYLFDLRTGKSAGLGRAHPPLAKDAQDRRAGGL